jgi:hypothetical protein
MKVKPKSDDCIQGTDGQLMVIAAFRYCLGRRSYIVGACLYWLGRWWDSFDRNTKRVVVRDTVRAIQDGEAGDTMDRAGWTEFASEKFALMSEDDQAWVLRESSNQPWPLENIPKNS